MSQRGTGHHHRVDAGLDAVADVLYGLPPDQFTAARTAAEKRARADGDRDLAKQVHALGKPTTVAWLANQLVRQHPDEIDPLLELGGALREATASLSGDELRKLSAQQHRVIQALIQQARAIARQAEHQLTDATAQGLETTLRAALAEGELADQLASGRLTAALEHVGFGATPGGGVRTPPKPREPAPAKEQSSDSKERDEHRRAAERERAERELAEAQTEADEAIAARNAAQQRLGEATAAVRELDATVKRLKEELGRAATQHASAEREAGKSRSALDHAERVARQAAARLKRAQRGGPDRT